MSEKTITRGSGLLEGFLARKRAEKANGLIPPGHRSGRILDVGSGNYPYFLVNTEFKEKFGIDIKVNRDLVPDGITLTSHDFHKNTALPFEDGFFDAVTMLAVFEHIKVDTLPELVHEILRVLRPGGVYVLTTPAFWTDMILKSMAKAGLLSAVEVEDHKALYSKRKVSSILQTAGFPASEIHSGYFELSMNIWAMARKQLNKSEPQLI
ncbi:MAG: methyltransferase domain-containing protein [Thermodesulfovibrionales bacterium]|nr:methyltransferase domain-containing protein [Thermodesulfovibrionales bacterium]